MSAPWVDLDPTLVVVAAGTTTVGAVSGALGCFAYLRRQGLVGDVVSHSALLGVVGAFVLVHAITGSASRSLFILVPGALVAGTAALMLARSVSIRTRLNDDASLGVMLSIFFGGGLFLLRWVQRQSPPIAGHTGLEDYIFGMAAAMTRADLWMIFALGGGALVVLFLMWKELKVFTFDPDFARSQGLPSRLLDTLLMGLLVAGVVIGIQTVGVILMIALLVTPAAAARQWTSSLSTMALLAAAFGAVAGAGGALLSASAASLPTGPVVVLLATTIFLLSLLLAPRRGVIARARARRVLRDVPPRAAGGAS
ncbi:metal ABC transporter permease [Planctomycetota bacterium]|jgi:manganese/zinc/iron transport system permease protein|nr:metal ABC transporter permease [Planctomycetota bacterium]MDB4450508.1 metal ABC transporter permease [bacterium]